MPADTACLVIEKAQRMAVLSGDETFGDIYFRFTAPFTEPPTVSPTFEIVPDDDAAPTHNTTYTITDHNAKECTVRVHVDQPPGEGKSVIIRCSAVMIGSGTDNAIRWEDEV